MKITFPITREMIDGLSDESLYQLSSQCLASLAARLVTKSAVNIEDCSLNRAASSAMAARGLLSGGTVKSALGLINRSN